jgi:integrase
MAQGSIFKRDGTKFWWIKYYRDGKPYRESSGAIRKRDAQRLLAKRQGSIASGTFTGLQPEKTTFFELVADLRNDYSVNQRKAQPQLGYYIERLTRYFRGMKAINITPDKILAYVAYRKRQKTHLNTLPANATINRELAALKRMFNLGKRLGKVVSVPYIQTLKEVNVRRGFFNPRDYVRLKKALPDYVRPIITLAYESGMRRAELLGLRWSQIDFHERLITLDPGTTKNDEPRTMWMSQELLEELRTQRSIRDGCFPSCQHVFFNYTTGKPIRSFRTAWQSACRKLGYDESVFHDFRRTGVRNLIRAGVPEKVAMRISGHKTRSVFDRYNITNEDDLIAAGKAVETYLKKQTGTVWAQLGEIDEARERRKSASA